MVNGEKDFGANDNNSIQLLLQSAACTERQRSVQQSSSYQHIKGIKSNFFETPCHFDFYQSGTVKTEENKGEKN